MRKCALIRRLLILSLFILFAGNLSFAAEVTFAWDPSAAPDVAGYQIGYGSSSGSYSVFLDAGNVTTCTVTGLPPGTYFFAVKAYNRVGERSGFSNEVSITIPAPDTAPPVISSVQATILAADSATIAWTTDEPANAQLEFGTSTAYTGITPLNTGLTTAHFQSLSGLMAGTLYHYHVRSADAARNLATSMDFTFTTLAPLDARPPAITDLHSTNITASGATIAWKTDEPSNSQVEYGVTIAYGSVVPLDTAMVTTHTQFPSGLMAGTLYHYRVNSRDAAGNLATSADSTFTTLAPPDKKAPTISDVTVINITGSGAVITWTTDEPSDSQVEYGTRAYGRATPVNTARVTTHSQSLSGLPAGTLYHFRVKSRDAAGNLAASPDFVFTTSF